MVEGQLKGIMYGHFRLDASGQQVRKMFGLRRDHFRPEDSSRRRIGVESQHAAVTPLENGAPLLPEVNVTHNNARIPQSRKRLADNGTLGIAEHDPQWGAAAVAGRRSIHTEDVATCDEAFIQRFMEDLGIPIGIAGKVNRKVPDL